VWQDSVERTDARRLTAKGKRIYQRRKETVERSFADAKQLHGHRYARYRGLHRVSGQCLLAAACQNMKKIALLLARFLCLWGGRSLFKWVWAALCGGYEKNGSHSENQTKNHMALCAA
jgi:hypothetical protein